MKCYKIDGLIKQVEKPSVLDFSIAYFGLFSFFKLTGKPILNQNIWVQYDFLEINTMLGIC